jgi:hypothetical protein
MRLAFVGQQAKPVQTEAAYRRIDIPCDCS